MKITEEHIMQFGLFTLSVKALKTPKLLTDVQRDGETQVIGEQRIYSGNSKSRQETSVTKVEPKYHL